MKLYYKNPYLAEFTAVVAGCVQARAGFFAVTLNQTAFYPEGGGQPFDTGFIGDARVTSVYERGGNVVHFTDRPVEEGGRVNCKIDWESRFAHMQGHTGEHILSGIIKERYGLQNVGFHMGADFITIDVDGILSDEQLETAETLANKAIYKNVPVEASFKSGDELDGLEYRSKLDIRENVRIVHIEGFDTCACCGVHCGMTGEIGLLKIVDRQKYKAGQRIYLLCGTKAMSDYSVKNKSVLDISALLSAKPYEITDAVKQLIEESANIKRSLAILKNRLLTEVAAKIPENSGCVCVFETGLNPDELRRLCLLITERAELAAVFSGDLVYKYALGSKTLDVRQLAARLNEEFNGRGGGKKELVQGSLTGTAESVEAFVSEYLG